MIIGIKSLLSAAEFTAANMEVTTAGYVSTAGEDCKKYSKSLLLLEIKIIEKKDSGETRNIPRDEREDQLKMAGGAAGGFVTRAFESMLKESSGNKKYTSLQTAIQSYLGLQFFRS
ncbi:hypothetical protein Tco_1278724 [Tanacetum coccineum]